MLVNDNPLLADHDQYATLSVDKILCIIEFVPPKPTKPAPWKILSSRKAYDHPFFKVREDEVQLPNGAIIPDYTIWENGDVSQTVVIKDNNVLLVELYKHGAQKVIFELPGGFVNKGENPEFTAKRELREETGILAKSLIHLTSCVHHPTKETSKTHLFLCTDLENTTTSQDLDSTEDIALHWIPIKKVFEMIKKGEIFQTGTIAGLFLAREILDLPKSKKNR